MVYHEDSKKYRIVVATPMWSSVRDLLRSNVLNVLLDNGSDILIVTPSIKDEKFQSEFSKLGVRLEDMLPAPNNFSLKCEKFLNTLSNVFMSGYIDTFKVRFLTMNQSLLAYFLIKIIGFLPKSINKNLALFFAYLRSVVMSKSLYINLLNEFKPDIVVCNFALGTSTRALDRYLAGSARKMNIPLVIQMNGWDNLTTKGMFAFRPNQLLVWTEIMKEEALSLHGFKPSEVKVTGCPGHDVFFHKKNYLKHDKIEFYNKLGLDKNKKLITYAVGGFGTYPDEAGLIKAIYYRFEEEFNDNWQLLIRPHPVYTKEEFIPLEELINKGNLIIDYPGNSVEHGVGADLDEQHLSHFVETLCYSDIILNYYSTINIDACALDRPVMNLSFTHREYDEKDSPLRFSKYTHNSNLHNRGYIPNVKSMNELIYWCKCYFNNPKILREERRKVVELFCWKLDGLSGKRNGLAIIDAINKTKV